ncbi:TrmH family RNA methyltransferase [Myceligenerans indicum]|uniref:TrmH family RNA methyltransferase n=1 Tax=Myceligenerans indicum TaxID=2593663 RepID=UPI0027DE5AE1|nr:RNA methyltransferase [Myceligenerans indicum]
MTTSDVVHLDDPADERLADYTRLTDVALRSKHEPAKGLYIAESTQVIHRALEAGHRPRSFLMAPKWLDTMADAIEACPGVPVYVAAEPVLREITGFHLHRGALAAMHRPPLVPAGEVLAAARGGAGARRVAVLEDLVDHTNVGCRELRTPETAEPQVGEPPRRSRVAVFEDLVDHTNLGAGFRSAAALGVDAVLVTPRCADPLYRRSVRVSMGTVFQVPWTRIESWPADIEVLKEAGFFVAGMTLGEGAITLDELVAQEHQNLALVFGTEGHGMRSDTDRLLDARVTIPMVGGVDSLNVAAASAVTFYATR